MVWMRARTKTRFLRKRVVLALLGGFATTAGVWMLISSWRHGPAIQMPVAVGFVLVGAFFLFRSVFAADSTFDVGGSFGPDHPDAEPGAAPPHELAPWQRRLWRGLYAVVGCVSLTLGVFVLIGNWRSGGYLWGGVAQALFLLPLGGLLASGAFASNRQLDEFTQHSGPGGPSGP